MGKNVSMIPVRTLCKEVSAEFPEEGMQKHVRAWLAGVATHFSDSSTNLCTESGVGKALLPLKQPGKALVIVSVQA